MALEKNFKCVPASGENSRKVITELTVLDRADKDTIYNLIFARTEAGARRILRSEYEK